MGRGRPFRRSDRTLRSPCCDVGGTRALPRIRSRRSAPVTHSPLNRVSVENSEGTEKSADFTRQLVMLVPRLRPSRRRSAGSVSFVVWQNWNPSISRFVIKGLSCVATATGRLECDPLNDCLGLALLGVAALPRDYGAVEARHRDPSLTGPPSPRGAFGHSSCCADCVPFRPLLSGFMCNPHGTFESCNVCALHSFRLIGYQTLLY